MSGELFGMLIVTVLLLLLFGGLVYYLIPRGRQKKDMRRDLADIGPCCQHGRG